MSLKITILYLQQSECVCVCVCVSMQCCIFSIINLSFLRISVCLCLYAYCLLSIFKPFISACVCVYVTERETSFNECSIVNVFNCQPCISHWPTRGLQPCSWIATSYRFQLQPQSNTPEPANHSLQGYLLISDRCVGAGLELKSAGW